ncbi:MAG: hemolysin III [Deltaproteobacteria bacterium]|nr:hemolysin III [Deltaproteobacteria bacterium]
MRGVLHLWAFFLFLAAGIWLVASQPAGSWWPAAIFASSVVGLFGSSALLHRVRWSPTWYPRMRRLDHAMIFGLVVGTYTPVFVVALAGRGVEPVFAAVCAMAGLGVLLTLFWPGAPKWVRSLVYLSVGWIGVAVVPDLIATVGWSGLAMVLAGGVAYSIGALVYALRRPNPFPRIFGYHEIFHALVIAAVVLHFALIRYWVLPG